MIVPQALASQLIAMLVFKKWIRLHVIEGNVFETPFALDLMDVDVVAPAKF